MADTEKSIKLYTLKQKLKTRELENGENKIIERFIKLPSTSYIKIQMR